MCGGKSRGSNSVYPEQVTMDFLKSVGVLLVVCIEHFAIWPLSVFFLIFLSIYFFRVKKVRFYRKMLFVWATNHCSMIIVLRICAVDVTVRMRAQNFIIAHFGKNTLSFSVIFRSISW